MKDEFDDKDDDQNKGRRSRPADDISDDEIVEIAKSRVKGPAIALIVLGVLSFGILAYSVFSYVYLLPGQLEDAKKQIDARKGKDPQQDKAIEDFTNMYFQGIKIGTPIAWVLIFITSSVVILSGVKLKNLESPGLVKAGSILSMIPCFSGCCILGIPFGIWAMVTMGNNDVKDGFAIMKRRKSFAQ